MPEIKDATQAKQLLARKLLYVSGHQIVVSEVERFNKPDIMSLTKSDMVIEYEIKVARSDLMGELNSVKQWKQEALRRVPAGSMSLDLNNDGIIEEDEKIGKCTKERKHDKYLNAGMREKRHDYYRYHIPNQFYFAVTADLVELAMDVCADTPYGVLDLNGIDGSSSIKKKAGWLHREEPTRSDIHHMAHVLSFSNWAKSGV